MTFRLELFDIVMFFPLTAVKTNVYQPQIIVRGFARNCLMNTPKFFKF